MFKTGHPVRVNAPWAKVHGLRGKIACCYDGEAHTLDIEKSIKEKQLVAGEDSESMYCVVLENGRPYDLLQSELEDCSTNNPEA